MKVTTHWLSGLLLLLGLSLAGCDRHPQPAAPAPTAAPAPAPGPALSAWFRPHEFSAAAFRQPPLEFGPFTRWWWPGNDVTNPELAREVRLFAANGFAGVEIQPFALGVGHLANVQHPDLPVPPDRLRRVESWDTPSYYAHLRTVLDAARAVGLTVDLTAGSGWPLGGP